MVFSSTIFLLYFLPLFLLVYHISPQKFRNIIILLFSIVFYAWGAPGFIFVILGATSADFFLVREIDRNKNEFHRKLLLAISVTLNLGLLIYFKYANFFIENVNALLQDIGLREVAWTKVVLPIGISFYTFQTLTYSIDVYRKVHPPLKKLTDYLLYIMSFPQMIAGPIVRFNTIADQIISRNEKLEDKLQGFYRFTIGLAKKVLIANVMAQQADLIINGDLTTLSTPMAWLGILAYTFQIYFDFSGYSDMAIGLGKMMGFDFPENFDSPYTSQSISEFWRRWHITLGRFMRDYLYIPLGGNRVSEGRLYFNLWVVFLLSGLWHGAAWNFVIWGAYHGLFLVLDRLFLLKILKKIGKWPAIIFTFFVTVVGWTLFRIEDFTALKAYLIKMFTWHNGQAIEIPSKFWVIGLVAILFAFLTAFKNGKRLEQFFFYQPEYRHKTHLAMAGLTLILLIASVSSITTSGFNPFIYFRF